MRTKSWLARSWRQTGAKGVLTGVLAVAAVLLGAGALAPVDVMAREARTVALEGQRFEETTDLSDRTLRLNGLGLRGVAWVKAFVAGLYLSAPTRDAGQAIAMQGPKRLRLKIMLAAPSSELTKSLIRRIDRHEPESVRAKLGDRLPQLAAMIDNLGELQPGDALDLDYVPDRGVSLRFNDKPVGTTVPGEDLYRAVLKIFVGEQPVDPRMKEGLLRGGV
ncbi:MAG: chalcone isomerase family protein [Aquabacterium sp.]